MASAAMPRTDATAKVGTSPRTPARTTENERDETLGRFAPVLMMPLFLALMVVAIHYLAP